uniref:carboxylesterase family protein n=1 Tax=Pseudophaeobacter profundi TaxID=3034152 RepID=UPI00242AE8CB
MASEFVEVTTKSGKLRGLVKTSALANKSYQSFQGIPYAKPPIVELRFKPPEPFGPWDGVRDALKEGSDCIQKHMLFGTPVGTEDCLYLNVYTTQAGKVDAKKAVMVWIHGGGFA